MTMHITALRAENVKRLKAVTIEPDGNVVVLGGANGAGKSSTLDAIWYALGGAGNLPGKPVRDGQGSAVAAVRLEGDGEPTLVVTRRIKADGGTTLEVVEERPDGIKSKLQSPQKVLDSLVGRIAFDPLEFSRQKPAEQVETLRSIVGLDTADVDGRIARCVEARADANREVKRLAALVESDEVFPDVPADEVSAEDVLADLRAARARNDEIGEAQRTARSLSDQVDKKRDEAAALRQRIAEHEAKVLEFQQTLRSVNASIDEASAKAEQVQQDVDALVAADVSAIEARLLSIEDTNRLVRSNQTAARHKALLDEASEQADQCQRAVDEARAEKLELMQSAKWPVEGLGFGEAGVTFRGLPFDQCSSAEMLRVSVAVGASQHARLNVMFIRDGSLLDAASLAAVHEIATQHGAQVWIERVGDGDECSVVIEDGEVSDDRTILGSEKRAKAKTT